ncbi:MAG: 2-dehydropantoate 2-reductase [Betaproteobacteria bacterium]|nr:2-dehydropantoate 2-reductase [Betaproteobacteria bacterium]
MIDHIAIIGVGAVGGLVGGRLAKAGYNVTLIDSWAEHIEAIKKDGLRITTPESDERVRVRCMHLNDVQSLMRIPVDAAMIATKSYDTGWATMMVKDYLSANGVVVSLQNCINEERIAGIVGWGRTIGCIAHTISARLEGPGHVVRTRMAGAAARHVFSVGEVHGRVTERARQLARIFGAVDGSIVTTNLWGERWAKLSLNSMHNGLAAVTGLNHHGVAENELARRFSIKLGGEAIRIGLALGFEIGEIRKVGAKTWLGASMGDAPSLGEIEKIILAEVKKMTDAGRPSTAQDVQKGRRTEIEFINGYVAAKGAEVGIAAPAQRAITELVREVEFGKLAPGMENLGLLVARAPL